MSTFLSFLGLLCLAQVTLKALPPFDSVLFGKRAKSTNDSATFVLFLVTLKATQRLFCLHFEKVMRQETTLVYA